MSASPVSQARTPSETILNDEMLARFATRAGAYDRDNRFFSEDFEELRESGYLKVAVPRDFGGGGLTLAEVVREQRRLAYFACTASRPEMRCRPVNEAGRLSFITKKQ